MSLLKLNKLTHVLARCLPTDLKNAAKFNVKIMEFDSNLNMVILVNILYISFLKLYYDHSTFQNMKQSMLMIQVVHVSLGMLY